MKAATVVRSILTAGAIVALLGSASSAALAAPTDQAQPGAQVTAVQTVKAKKPARAHVVRRSVGQAGLVQLPDPVMIGTTTQYWYRPVTAPGRSGLRRQAYVISAEAPAAGQGWQCCLILGIAY